MEEDRAKVYLLGEETVREVANKCKESTRWMESVFTYEFDRSYLSNEQKLKQKEYSWNTSETANAYLENKYIDKIINKLLTNAILNGCKENINEVVHNAFLDSKLQYKLYLYDRENNHIAASAQIYINDASLRYVNEEEEEEEVSTDLNELEKILSERTIKTTYHDDGNNVYLEKVDFDVRANDFTNVNKLINNSIKRCIRENFTYCIKKGEIIIPEEYLAKGKEGIEEWRGLKSSANKNNSMEKKMLKEVYADKKKATFRALNDVMDAIINPNTGWDIPKLHVDGRWNSQKRSKLSNKIIDTSNKQKFLEMTDEEILNSVKAYWKQELQDALTRVDGVKLKEGKM